jgi:CheY-like chemotaxis protein
MTDVTDRQRFTAQPVKHHPGVEGPDCRAPEAQALAARGSSTFEIFLPLAASGETPAPAVQRPPERTAGPKAPSETILLVEDDDQVRNLTLAILHREGYSVFSAGHGEAALALVDAHDGPLHMLLTDVMLPGMDGRQVFQKVAETHPELKVLYMSGYLVDEVVDSRGIQKKSANFIQKPFSIEELVERVRQVLDGQLQAGPPSGRFDHHEP